MPKGSRRITITVSEAEHTAWRVIAAREGLSLAAWVRRAGNKQVEQFATRDGTPFFKQLLDSLKRHELSWAPMFTPLYCLGHEILRVTLS